MRAVRYQIVTAALGFAVLCNTAQAVDAQSALTNLFEVPEGCTAFLTVQSRSCLISHYWRCDADPEGTHWRATLDQDGAFYLNYSDAEFRWLRAYNLRSGSQDILIEPEEDPASITELLSTGRDTMVFSIREERPDGVFQRDYTGYDQVDGTTVEIDGRTLLVTEFAYQWQTEAGPRSTSGSQFVSEEMMLFFGGIETVTTPSGEVFEGNYSPVDFAGPGEEGFLSTDPQYDCEDIMSGLDMPPVWRAAQ